MSMGHIISTAVTAAVVRISTIDGTLIGKVLSMST